MIHINVNADVEKKSVCSRFLQGRSFERTSGRSSP